MGINLRKCNRCGDEINRCGDEIDLYSKYIKKNSKIFKILFPVIFNDTIISDKIYCAFCDREDKLKKILVD